LSKQVSKSHRKIAERGKIDKTVGKPFIKDAKFSTRNVDVFYGEKQAIFDANIDKTISIFVLEAP
jgi:phosphate transport system ATP-binding protein